MSSTTTTEDSTVTASLKLIKLQGPIVALKTGGFQINGGGGVGYVNIYPASATKLFYNGLKPTVGYYAVVDISGTLSSFTPAAIALSTSQPGTVSTSGTIESEQPYGIAIKLDSTGAYIPLAFNTQTNLYGFIGTGVHVSASGVGSTATAIFPASVTSTSTTTTSTPSPSSTPSWNMHVHGSIVAIKSSTELQINGGSGVGYLNVYTTGSTIKNYNGLTPAVGVYADVYGNGSVSTYVTATDVTLTSSTTGGATPAPTAAPYSGTAPAHVMTSAVVWGYGGVPTTVSIASVKPYVSWVQTGSAYAGDMRSNGLKVDIYENFWRNYSSDNPTVGYTDLKPGGTHAPAEAKTCTGTAIYDSTYGGGYEADARSSYAAGHAQVFNNYRIQSYSGQYDAIFSDDTGAMGGLPLPCNWSLSSYQSYTNSVHASLKVPIFVNTLGAAANPVNQVGYTNASNVIGGMCEICLAGNRSGTDYAQTGSYWQGIENAAIQLVANHKIFWDYARATGYPQSETALRNYIYASFLLTYNPSYSMLQEAFKSSYNFPVMPETGFVPESPVTTASTVTGYQTSTGAYMRQFGSCYYRGSYKGKCAVVVNPTGSTVTIPTTAYSHALGLVGGGVLDGGYVTFGNGRPSSLAPGQGVILLP
ncbi:MAG TPA: hypothetical protein VFN37_02995 [Candidatus Baltobacteraceae bacterium]|nr:hypothetical protein [Candidatus Baltobacteraceae bacterium]